MNQMIKFRILHKTQYFLKMLNKQWKEIISAFEDTKTVIPAKYNQLFLKNQNLIVKNAQKYVSMLR